MQEILINFTSPHFQKFNPNHHSICIFPDERGDGFDLSVIEKLRVLLEKSVNETLLLPETIVVRSYIKPITLREPEFSLATLVNWEPLLQDLPPAESKLYPEGEAPKDVISYRSQAPYLSFSVGTNNFDIPVFNVCRDDGKSGLGINIPFIKVFVKTRKVDEGKGKEEVEDDDLETCD